MSLTTVTLWAFFKALAAGIGAESAARRAQCVFSPRSAYRIAARLRRRAGQWKAWLTAQSPPPPSSSRLAEALLLAHLTLVLGEEPLRGWQEATGQSAL